MLLSNDPEMSNLGVRLLVRVYPAEIISFFKRHANHESRGSGVMYGHITPNTGKFRHHYSKLLVQVHSAEDLSIFRNIAGELFLLTRTEVSKFIRKTEYTEL